MAGSNGQRARQAADAVPSRRADNFSCQSDREQRSQPRARVHRTGSTLIVAAAILAPFKPLRSRLKASRNEVSSTLRLDHFPIHARSSHAIIPSTTATTVVAISMVRRENRGGG